MDYDSLMQAAFEATFPSMELTQGHIYWGGENRAYLYWGGQGYGDFSILPALVSESEDKVKEDLERFVYSSVPVVGDEVDPARVWLDPSTGHLNASVLRPHGIRRSLELPKIGGIGEAISASNYKAELDGSVACIAGDGEALAQSLLLGREAFWETVSPWFDRTADISVAFPSDPETNIVFVGSTRSLQRIREDLTFDGEAHCFEINAWFALSDQIQEEDPNA